MHFVLDVHCGNANPSGMTELAPEIVDIETRANEAGLDLNTVLSRAEVSFTTWWRWKRGDTEPRLATLRRIRQSITEMTDERRAEAA